MKIDATIPISKEFALSVIEHVQVAMKVTRLLMERVEKEKAAKEAPMDLETAQQSQPSDALQ